MGKISNCSCGSPPAMMWRIIDDTLFFHMQCNHCGRQGKSNRDVNKCVEDWNKKNG